MAAVAFVNGIGQIVNSVSGVASSINQWTSDTIPGVKALNGMSGGKKCILALALASGAYYAKSKSDEAKRAARKKKYPNEQPKPRQRTFMQRLKTIVKLIFAGKTGKKTLFTLIGLSVLLLLRTLLSIQVGVETGAIAEQLVQKNWEGFVTKVVGFLLLGIPAAVVNSLLKYSTTMLSLLSQRQLSDHINSSYIKGTNFYKATQLPSSKIENVDQRVTADVQAFCVELASLYSSIFKPMLDVIFNTLKLSGMMGFKAPVVIFTWYLFFGAIQMTALKRLDIKNNSKKLSEHEGNYRTAHSRLIVYAEEIAFYEGAERERGIITTMFDTLFRHHAKLEGLKTVVGILDQFLLKYGTSITGYALLAIPVFFSPPSAETQDMAALTRNYVLNRQLLMDLSIGIGTLMTTMTTIASFAGITQRVSEVLEKVEELNDKSKTEENFALRPSEEAIIALEEEGGNSIVSPNTSLSLVEWLSEWSDRCETLRNTQTLSKTITLLNNTVVDADAPDAALVSDTTFTELGFEFAKPQMLVCGENIRFSKAAIVSPDGRLLVKDLTLTITPGQNVMITGPNGCGKSSLFRVLGELWPPYAGTVMKPRKEDILFVPQKPYLVKGTLRDQIIYPHTVEDMRAKGVSDDDLMRLLEVVDPARSITKEWKFDDVRDWFNAFSGGQKQRVAMARVFYHRPRYAILDECTSAVSSDVEGTIYRTCRTLGITIFTVSHRPNLQQYHDFQLAFDGHGNYTYITSVEAEESKQH